MPGLFVVWVLAFLCCGCDVRATLDRHWPDAYWRTGPYVLIAVDTEAQMDLSFDLSGHETVTLVGPTVFSVGANARFVVVKQHPSADGLRFDRRVTHYFIVDRATESFEGERQSPVVIGPLSRADYERLSRELDLPEFGKTFRTLEWRRTDE
jgi:hypothetical protein